MAAGLPNSNFAASMFGPPVGTDSALQYAQTQQQFQMNLVTQQMQDQQLAMQMAMQQQYMQQQQMMLMQQQQMALAGGYPQQMVMMQQPAMMGGFPQLGGYPQQMGMAQQSAGGGQMQQIIQMLTMILQVLTGGGVQQQMPVMPGYPQQALGGLSQVGGLGGMAPQSGGGLFGGVTSMAGIDAAINKTLGSIANTLPLARVGISM